MTRIVGSRPMWQGFDFPHGEADDAARAVLPEAVRRSHDRLCTVSRTVELGTPVVRRVVASPGR